MPGAFFLLKQAWFKYLKDKCGLRHESVSLMPAMKSRGLDLLCVLLRSKVMKYGIPFLCSTIEYDAPTISLSGSLRNGVSFESTLRDSRYPSYHLGTSAKMTEKLLRW
jgi:hypothetical protein